FLRRLPPRSQDMPGQQKEIGGQQKRGRSPAFEQDFQIVVMRVIDVAAEYHPPFFIYLVASFEIAEAYAENPVLADSLHGGLRELAAPEFGIEGLNVDLRPCADAVGRYSREDDEHAKP